MSPNRANDSDLILANGQIYTMDPACPWAEALAIRGGRIVAVGSEATVRAATPQTRVIDLRNKMAMPGIIDVHNRFRGSTTLSVPQLARALSDCESRGIASVCNVRSCARKLFESTHDLVKRKIVRDKD